jgi:hypothetical protein
LLYPFCLPVFSILTRKTPNTDFSEDATGDAVRLPVNPMTVIGGVHVRRRSVFSEAVF